jgi:hypothetical protein
VSCGEVEEGCGVHARVEYSLGKEYCPRYYCAVLLGVSTGLPALHLQASFVRDILSRTVVAVLERWRLRLKLLFEIVARLQDTVELLPKADMVMEQEKNWQQMLDNVMCSRGGAVLGKRERDVFLSVSFMLDYSTVRVSSPTTVHVSSTIVGHGLS